jgi:hypothetical protein
MSNLRFLKVLSNLITNLHHDGYLGSKIASRLKFTTFQLLIYQAS